jgi:hypothetical protein
MTRSARITSRLTCSYPGTGTGIVMGETGGDKWHDHSQTGKQPFALSTPPS